MTYYDIYLYALAFIGEPEDSTGAADYKKRAALLLPHIVSSLSEINLYLREDAPRNTEMYLISLDSEFPLDVSLCASASLELASLLIIDELPELSQTLAKRANEEKTRIAAKASTVGSIREVY